MEIGWEILQRNREKGATKTASGKRNVVATFMRILLFLVLWNRFRLGNCAFSVTTHGRKCAIPFVDIPDLMIK